MATTRRMTFLAHPSAATRIRFVLDALVSDPNAHPHTLHALAGDPALAWATGPARLLAHPAAGDLDPRPLVAQATSAAELLEDVLAATSTTAAMRTSLLACASPDDLWELVRVGANLTADQIQAAYDVRVAGRTHATTATQVLADATDLARHPSTPRHLALEAIATATKRASVDFTSTILTVLAAARRHHVDVAHVLADTPIDAMNASVRAELSVYLELAATHPDPLVAYATIRSSRNSGQLLNRTWPQFISATHDPAIASAALERAPHNIAVHATILDGPHLGELALAALTQYCAAPYPLTDADAQGEQRTRSAIVNDAIALTRRSDTDAVAVLRAAARHTKPNERARVMAAALSSCAHTDASAIQTLDVLDTHAQSPTTLPGGYVALALNPQTPGAVRTAALQRANDPGTSTSDRNAHAVAQALNGDPRAAGRVTLDDLTGYEPPAQALRAAARRAAHSHPSWPPTPETGIALLTVAEEHVGTLDELLDTAAAIST